ncbi:hypothetical protein PA905_01210 [Planktothrix agardhii CCAP 1459/11A]|uniref:Uncharacterized protein n=1 Tax=Planktothrix agardhii CCAP 1459/11A TaxID=282420 RepID=A0A4P5Z8R2_PLAAG|nr:hypothetical protein [Planktothrix agardhii]GDZ92426.1 hypothetical protein PA905_01210 [Planktothrix agardhii CCAP 1459/11A]
MNIFKHRLVNGWLSSLILATLFLDTGNLVYAQARSSGVSSLAELGCQGSNRSNYFAANKDFIVGFEVFRAVGYLKTSQGLTPDGKSYTLGYNGSRTACRLASPGETPRFRTLSLAIGIPDDHAYGKGSVSRLSIYKDGQFYEYKDLTAGQKVLWIIDVTNTRSIGLAGECIKAGSAWNTQGCPAIYFFEDLLE